jgi:hypothetical protein
MERATQGWANRGHVCQLVKQELLLRARKSTATQPGEELEGSGTIAPEVSCLARQADGEFSGWLGHLPLICLRTSA